MLQNGALKALLTLLLYQVNGQQCPSGFSPVAGGSKCVQGIDRLYSWNDAEFICHNVLGGHLVSISNAFENAFFASLSKNLSATGRSSIGYSNAGGTYQWTDDSQQGYSNWAPGEPDTTNPINCVYISGYSAKWFSIRCDEVNTVLCESNPAAVPKSCPSGWTYFDVTKFCYKTFFNPVNVNAAENTCVAAGGHLVSIHSAAENEFVAELSSAHIPLYNWTSCTWTGLRNVNHNGVWSWTDGTRVDYFNWAPGEPNNLQNDEYCVHIYTDILSTIPYLPNQPYIHQWNDLNCDNPMRAFVCKRAAIFQ